VPCVQLPLITSLLFIYCGFRARIITGQVVSFQVFEGTYDSLDMQLSRKYDSAHTGPITGRANLMAVALAIRSKGRNQ
jgi:hypothetical protein